MAETRATYELENPGDILELYQETKDPELRNALTLHYSYIAKSVAVQMRGITSSYAQIDDIVNEGILTLMDCLDKYTPSKGMKFENYAYMRIKNANIDFVRKQDWVPRRVRKTAREVSDAYNELSTKLMREPSSKELAEFMEISEDALSKHYTEMSSGSVVSFEDMLQNAMNSGAPDPESQIMGSNEEGTPEQGLMQNEMRQQLMKAIESLTEKERMVVSLYYYEHLKLHEIATIMGVSESRVSQTHSKAILKMKKVMMEYLAD